MNITKSDYPILLNMHKAVDNSVIDKIQKFVENNYRDITTSQLRNIFAEVKQAKLNELPLKRPKLAYIRGRTDARKRGMHNLLELLDNLIKEIGTTETEDNKEKLTGFKTFFEAVLAYHKFYEKVGVQKQHNKTKKIKF